MNTITHEFVNFNADHLAKKTKEEFVKEFEDTKVYANFSPADRQKLLEEAWLKCKKAVDPKFGEAPAATGNAPTDQVEPAPKEKKSK